MSESQFGTNSIRKRKRVLYEGTDVIREGMPVAYNYDTTSNILGINTGVTPQVKSITTTEGGSNEGKFQRVELCTVANAAFFAGVVAGTSFDGLTGTGNTWLDIYEANGSIVPVRTDKSITQKDKLYLEAGQQTVVNDSSAMPCIGVAVETIDRSSVNGTILAKVNAVVACDVIDSVTATSRTAVQLPTDAIWKNFNLKELRDNPFSGALVEADFRRGSDFPANIFEAAASIITMNTEEAGALSLLGSVDNESCEIQYPCPIVSSAGKKWAFEGRMKVNTVTGDDLGFFFGLMAASANLSGALIDDNGAATADVDNVGFQSFHADTTGVDAVYTNSGDTPIVHDADVKAMTINTYFTVGMYFDGTDIQIYVDGVNTADPILAADIIAGGDDFPQASVLVPTLATLNGAAEDDTLIVDWFIFASEG